MQSVGQISSPLAEKRLRFSAMRKQMIGRRAYSDVSGSRLRGLDTGTSPAPSSVSSSPKSGSCSPKSRYSELEEKVYNQQGC
jgi:hypothetical protein